MKKIKCCQKSIEFEMIEITKAELKELLENNSILISDSDAEWIAVECGDDEIVGCVIGEIDKINSKNNTELWFINRYYFQESYEIKELKMEYFDFWSDKRIKNNYMNVWKVYKKLHKQKLKDKDYTLSIKEWLKKMKRELEIYNIEEVAKKNHISKKLVKKIAKINEDFLRFL